MDVCVQLLKWQNIELVRCQLISRGYCWDYTFLEQSSMNLSHRYIYIYIYIEIDKLF